MTVGDVRSLNTWLRQHADDGALEQGEGQWGNEADPPPSGSSICHREAIPGSTGQGLILAGGGAPAAAEPTAQETPAALPEPHRPIHLPPDPSRPHLQIP